MRPAVRFSSASGQWIIGLCGLTVVATACGSTTSGTTPSASPMVSGSPSSSPTASGGSTSLGSMVLVTDQSGYKYELRASAVQKTPTLTSSSGQPSDAPPGRVFLTFIVQVKNPLTDRGEPFDLANRFYLDIPQTSISAFDPIQCSPAPTPTATCEIYTEVNMMYPVAAPLTGNLELPPAGQALPEFVQFVVWGSGSFSANSPPPSVVEAAPVEQLRLHVAVGSSPYSDAPPPIPIPLGP